LYSQAEVKTADGDRLSFGEELAAAALAFANFTVAAIKSAPLVSA